MEKLKLMLRTFAKERDWDQFHTPKNLAMALSVEVSEVIECFQWLTENESQNLSETKLQQIEQELGDVLIYLVRLSDKLNIDLIKAAKNKIIINEKKYPKDKVKGSAKKYNEIDK